MGDAVSGDFVRLALTLIHQLPSSPSEIPDEAVLLRLQMLFGSMLMSALQLVDRREVLHITLPTKRQIWQVGSSSSAPYTIHLTLPLSKQATASPCTQDPKDSVVAPGAHAEAIGTGGLVAAQADRTQRQAITTDDEKAHEQIRLEYVEHALLSFQGVYCPCTGFAYNSLTSERNIFCKHLLAILLADRMNRAYRTEALMHNVAGLLDVTRTLRPEPDEAPKMPGAEVKTEVDE